jgi:UPF0716 protein FxsA
MILKLALLFTIVPTVEIALLVFIGGQIGVVWTTVIVLATGILGAWLARREGAGVLRILRDDLRRGLPPARHIAEGVAVLVGALLLITPGVLTDLTGLALILPFTRRWIAPLALRWIVRRVTGDAALADALGRDPDAAPPPPAPSPAGPRRTPFDHPVPDSWSAPDDR